MKRPDWRKHTTITLKISYQHTKLWADYVKSVHQFHREWNKRKKNAFESLVILFNLNWICIVNKAETSAISYVFYLFGKFVLYMMFICSHQHGFFAVSTNVLTSILYFLYQNTFTSILQILVIGQYWRTDSRRIAQNSVNCLRFGQHLTHTSICMSAYTYTCTTYTAYSDIRVRIR